MANKKEILHGISLTKDEASAFYDWLTDRRGKTFFDYMEQEAQLAHERALIRIDPDIQVEYAVIDSQRMLEAERIYNELKEIVETVSESLRERF